MMVSLEEGQRRRLLCLLKFLQSFHSRKKRVVSDVIDVDEKIGHEDLFFENNATVRGAGFFSGSFSYELQKQKVSDPPDPPPAIKEWIAVDLNDPYRQISRVELRRL